MTSADEVITELDLLAYVDGHLDPARRRSVEAYLERNPEAARRVALDLAIKDGIRQLFERRYQEEPPARLTAILDPKPRQPRAFHPMPRVAAGLGLMVLAGGLGFAAGQHQSQPDLASMLAQNSNNVSQAHLTTVANNGNGTMEPVAWLAERVRPAENPPRLDAVGFQLVGQGLVGNPARPAVQLTYTDKQGRQVELFLQARWERSEPQFRFHESGGRGLLYWTNGPLVFAMTGDIPPDELRGLAQVIDQGSDPEAAGVSEHVVMVPPEAFVGAGTDEDAEAKRAILPVVSGALR
ncbi:anti-sigma factor [Telmatospirillum sp. J64-1]|uniref:anti-sigma factor family protein n=1 Tax=Telmatospirillum sp. J64-1 TaxID=2502183 RepID=UPI00115C729D|nr:anti-sigma factor [Telmatospirillum sp. J64-1]